jgi:hypothetical protein
MLKALTRMVFAVMAVVCLLIGIFWIWFVQAYVMNWVEGETAVFYALTILWFILSALFWWTFRRLAKQDREN